MQIHVPDPAYTSSERARASFRLAIKIALAQGGFWRDTSTESVGCPRLAPPKMSKRAEPRQRANNNLDTAERRMWSASVLGKYWALQLPEAALVVVFLLLLQEWLGFPTWLTWSLVGLWVAKDAALYPFVWRSYDPGHPAILHSLDGEYGVATERLDRSVYVRVRGELWLAELDRGARPVDKDEPVQIRARRGLTVIVAAVGNVRES